MTVVIFAIIHANIHAMEAVLVDRRESSLF